MKDVILYIHGKGGSAAESEHYRPLFPECEVIGLDYHGNTPWEAGKEILDAVNNLNTEYKNITLIANSIGAYFSMNAGIDRLTSYETIAAFAKDRDAKLTVMEHGEHWFHTEEQIQFLNDWIRKCHSVL